MAGEINGFDFFLLRTPRLPAHTIRDVNACADEKELAQFMYSFFQDAEMLDAIFLASQDLHVQLTSSLKKGAEAFSPKLLLTLYKYIIRMAGRSTPYGKFSGVALGEITDEHTAIQLTGNHHPSMRLDMGFSAYLSKWVLANTDLWNSLSYHTNNSLHEFDDHYRYIEYKENAGKRNYSWARVSKNPLLNEILSMAKEGKPFADLVNYITKKIGVPGPKAVSYVQKLIEIQLLISELEPAVTGSIPFTTLMERVKHMETTKPIVSVLNDIEQFLADNKKSRTFAFGLKDRVGKTLPDWKDKDILQADLRTETLSNKLNKHVLDTLTDEIKELLPLNRKTTPADLAAFCTRFSTKYGQMEVPLLEALDQERGVGYGDPTRQYINDMPLLEDIKVNAKSSKEGSGNPLQSLIKRFWSEHMYDKPIIELDLEKIKNEANSSADSSSSLPLTFYTIGNFIAKNAEELDQGNFKFNLLSGGGTSAVPLMARFCHLDQQLEKKLKDCVEGEEMDSHNAVLAEVIHLPDDRIGNILLRPKLRKYEIPLIGHSAVDSEYQILLSDLCVSVKNGQAILYSKRLGKVVIPRLSSAHNYHYGISAYRFLCDLQHQTNTLDISWDWGELESQTFLPRVTYKHIILSRARWKIPKDFLKEVFDMERSDAITIMKAKYDLPSKVLLADGDNELLIDLRHFVGARILLERLEKGDVILYEDIFDTNESPVNGINGENYRHEVILPIKVNATSDMPQAEPRPEVSVCRKFHPGSEWAYIKVYCGAKETEQVLTNHVGPMVSQLKCDGVIQKWFFIRYQDPDPHLRIRFLLDSVDGSPKFTSFFETVNGHVTPLLERGIIQKMQYDTYERELERYRPDCMEACESIFHIDSESVLAMLSFFREDGGEQLRWLTAAMGVDNLLDSFGLDNLSKLTLVDSWRDAFFAEFNADKTLSQQLDIKFRKIRDTLNQYFYCSDGYKNQTHDILNDRFIKLMSIGTNILSKIGYQFPHQSKSKEKGHLVSSLAHMYINRLFFFNQRENEMVIYHFLGKYYFSVVKREQIKMSTSKSPTY